MLSRFLANGYLHLLINNLILDFELLQKTDVHKLVLARRILIFMMENLLEDSRLWITAQLRIGRAMRSEWEHRKTGRVFSHSLIFHYITDEIFTN